MGKKVLLVDYENIQAVDLASIPKDTKVLCVFGAKQKSVPNELVGQAQKLGKRFTYIFIKAVQHNAADFCIAFYLGEYLTKDPTTEYIILSKDKKGFDPLVRHLTDERKFHVRRVNAQKDAFPSPVIRAKHQDNFERAIELLSKEKNRPLKNKGLEGKIKSWFPKLNVEERRTLLKRLFDAGNVSASGVSLTYNFGRISHSA